MENHEQSAITDEKMGITALMTPYETEEEEIRYSLQVFEARCGRKPNSYRMTLGSCEEAERYLAEKYLGMPTLVLHL